MLPSTSHPSSLPGGPPTTASVALNLTGAAANLKSLISLSCILNANPNISSIGNINIIEQTSTPTSGNDDDDDITRGDDDETTLALCYMPMIFQFGQTALGIYEGVASMALAM